MALQVSGGAFGIHIEHKQSGGRLEFRAINDLRGHSFEGHLEDKRGATSKPYDEPMRFWLWRSGFGCYDSQNEVFKRWLTDLCEWTKSYWFNNHSTWTHGAGFPGYSHLKNDRADEVVGSYKSFVEFAKKCDELIAELKNLTVERDASREE